MINDKIFAEGFRFTTFNFKKYKRNDIRGGAKMHFLAYMISGSARLVSEKESVSVGEGDIFYIPKGLSYESYWYGEPNVEFASLGFEFLPASNGERFATQTLSGSDEDIKEIVALARAGITSSSAIGSLYTVLGKLIPKMRLSSAGRGSGIVLKVKKYINENPDKSVKDIAKHFAVSESGLYFAFKKHSDQSISEYRSQVVMNASRDMLITTDTPIEEISDRLGFSSSSYFRKCFKTHFGVSPRTMRKKNGI